MFVSKQDMILQDQQECSPPIAINSEPLTYQQVEHLMPLRHMDKRAIAGLSHQILTYAQHSIIYRAKQPSNHVYYLLEGCVTLQSLNGQNYQITADSLRARLPINNSLRHTATATASSEVKLLAIEKDVTQLWEMQESKSINCVELIDIQLPEKFVNLPFWQSFVETYRANKLEMPYLPLVSWRLQQAEKHDSDIQLIVDIIENNTDIANKLLQMANGPLYALARQLNNCSEVIDQLGISPTSNLVKSVSMKTLFNCHDQHLQLAMNNLWRRSLYVATISFIMAKETELVDSERAFLAGLISDIGITVLLQYAARFSDKYPDDKHLEEAVPYISEPLGVLILNTLGLGEDLIEVTLHSEDWFYQNGENITLVDIVILAKLHSYFGSHKANSIPTMQSIPAYNKLGVTNPNFSLKVLNEVNQCFRAILPIFA